MKYDFTTLQDRSKVGSHKWDGMKRANPNISADAIPFTTADMEFLNAPEIGQAIADYAVNNILGYTGPGDDYYESVSNWMKKHHGLNVSKENTIIYPGVIPAFYKAVETFCKEGDGIIIMPPVYGPFFGAANSNGCHLVKCPLFNNDEYYTINYELLEELCKDENNRMLIFCNPHNPVGRVWKKEELFKVAKICKDNNVLLLSDEIHFDIIMPEFTCTSMGTFDEYLDNLILCTAPSKTFNLASLQTSNIFVWNKDMYHALVKNKSANCIESLNILGYVACKTAYDKCGEWMDEMINVVDENIKYFRNYIKENIPEIKLGVTEGTYLCWLNCNALGMTLPELDKYFSEREIFFVSGNSFGAEGEAYMRVNLACPKRYVEALCEKLLAAVKELR